MSGPKPSAAWTQAWKEVSTTPINDIKAVFGTGDLYQATQNRCNEIELDELSNYRTVSHTPPVPECVNIFAKIMGHENDSVESVDVAGDICTIKIAWSCRSCYQSEYYSVPVAVLMDANPEKAIRLWALRNQADESKNKIEEYRKSVTYYQTQYDTLVEKIRQVESDG